MAMHLLGQEYKVDNAFRENTAAYIAAAHKDVISWQDKEGAWPIKGFMQQNGSEGAAYATAFATLCLGVPEGRLSIYQRTPPRLPGVAR
jgi:hypothetical protein